MVRARSLSSLRERIERCLATSDSRAVLEPQAESEAAALAATVTDFTADIEAVHTLGWWHWCRYLVLSEGEGAPELARALTLLEPVYRVLPDKVPEPVREHLARAAGGTRAAEGTDPGAWAARAYELLVQAERTQDRGAADEAARLLRRLLAEVPQDHPEYDTAEMNLGSALLLRSGPGRRDDIDKAVQVLRRVEARLAGGGGVLAHGRALVNLGSALTQRFAMTRDADDAAEAAKVLRRAAGLLPEESPENVPALFALAMALAARNEATGDDAALDEAVALLESLDTGHPTARSQRARISAARAALMQRRHERGGDLDSLRDRAAVLRQEARRLAKGDPRLLQVLDDLALTLRRLAELAADTGALREAEDVLREAFEAAPADSPDRDLRREDLAQLLITDHLATGDAEPLATAIAVLRALVTGPEPDPTVRMRYLNHLGNALALRHRLYGDQESLDEAVGLLREALELPGTDPRIRGPVASTLAAALDAVFGLAQNPGTLDESIALHREALAAEPSDSPELPRLRSNLGNALRMRHDVSGGSAPLDEARELLEQAAEGMPADHPRRPMVLANLGMCLAALHRTAPDPETARQALAALRASVSGLRPGHPEHPHAVGMLVHTLRRLHEETDDPALREEAEDALRSVGATPPRTLAERSVFRSRLRRIGRDRAADDAEPEPLIKRFRDWAENPGGHLELTGPAAQDEARQLRELLDTGGAADPVAAVLTLGMYHLARHRLDTRLTDDLVAAVECFAEGARSLPEAVPPALRPLTRLDRPDADTGPSDAEDAVLARIDTLFLAGHYGHATGDRRALELAVRTGRSLLAEHDEEARDVILNGLAGALLVLVEDHGALALLDELIGLLEEAVSRTPHDDERHPDLLARLSGTLMRRFQRDHQPQDIDRAVAGHRAALAAVGPDGSLTDRGEHLTNLGLALQARYKAGPSSDAADLDEAVSAFHAALDALPGDAVLRAGVLTNLGGALTERYEITRDAADLAAALDARREAVRDLPEEHPQRPLALVNVAVTLLTAVRLPPVPPPPPAARSASADLVAEAVALHRTALILTPEDNPRHPAMLGCLGSALVTQHQETGDRRPLHEAVVHLQRAVQLCETRGRPDAPYKDLSSALLMRHLLTGALGDLDDAVATGLAALDAEPEQADLLDHLATMLSTRYERTGSPDDLAEAIERGRAAVTASVPGTGGHAMHSHNLALAHSRRHQLLGDPADLDEAVRLVRETLPALARHLPHRVQQARITFAELLEDRYTSTSSRADLEEALLILRDVADHIPSSGPDATALSASCGALLTNLAQHVDDPGPLLEEGLRLSRAALDGTPAAHDSLPVRQAQLGSALAQFYRLTGDLDALNEAIVLGQEAVRRRPPGRLDRSGMMSSLALRLRERFARSGDVADLDDATALERGALDLIPADAPRRAQALANLAGSLTQHARVTGRAEELDEAVDLARAAVEATAPGDFDGARRRTVLAICLTYRFEACGDTADLTEAVRLARDTLAQGITDDEMGPTLRSDLAVTLLAGFQHTRDPAILSETIGQLELAAAAFPADHPARCVALTNLGTALVDRAELTGDRTDLDAALAHWRDAARTASGPPPNRLVAATSWASRAGAAALAARATESAEDAARRTREALTAFTEAVTLLPLVAWRGLDRPAQERHLAERLGLACEAAAWAVESGAPERGLELLEQGRSVLWAQLLDTRTEFDDLRTARPDLAARLEALRTAWQGPVPEADAVPAGPDGVPAVVWSRRDPGHARRDRVTRQQGTAGAWDRLLTEIRACRGFDGFLLPPRARDLLPAAGDGAVVVLNVAQLRCDALVVRRTGVSTVPLPDLTAQDAYAASAAYLEALRCLLRPRRLHPRERDRARKTLTQSLVWLWETAAGPVLSALGHTGPPGPDADWPRVWWCPTGPLTTMPVHAAGPGAPDAPAVLDLVVSSYAPTLRSVARARAPQADGGPEGTLVVGLPRTPYLPREAPLPGTEEEVARVEGFFPGACTTLKGAQATRERVLAELSRHRDVHLCCHGGQDPDAPSRGRLYLHDAPLTMTALSRYSHPYARMAYLSACDTATGGVQLSDESLSVASAMQLIGFRHVIATLWPIGDAAAPGVATAVYGRLAGEKAADLPAGEALHHAVRELRAAAPGDPLRWAAYVHVGG